MKKGIGYNRKCTRLQCDATTNTNDSRNSQITKCTPQMMEGNKQSNNSSTNCNYEEAISTHNTMSMQYNISAKYFAAENTMQEAFKAADFSFFKELFDTKNNSSSHQFLQKLALQINATNHNENLQFSLGILSIFSHVISFISAIYILSLPLFLLFLSLCSFFLIKN